MQQNLTRAQQFLRWATVWPQYTSAESEGAAVLLSTGELRPHLMQCGLAEAYLHTKCHLDPYSRLATTDMGQKLGRGCALFFWGEMGPHPIQFCLGRGLPLCQVAS